MSYFSSLFAQLTRPLGDDPAESLFDTPHKAAKPKSGIKNKKKILSALNICFSQIELKSTEYDVSLHFIQGDENKVLVLVKLYRYDKRVMVRTKQAEALFNQALLSLWMEAVVFWRVDPSVATPYDSKGTRSRLQPLESEQVSVTDALSRMD